MGSKVWFASPLENGNILFKQSNSWILKNIWSSSMLWNNANAIGVKTLRLNPLHHFFITSLWYALTSVKFKRWRRPMNVTKIGRYPFGPRCTPSLNNVEKNRKVTVRRGKWAKDTVKSGVGSDELPETVRVVYALIANNVMLLIIIFSKMLPIPPPSYLLGCLIRLTAL